MDDIIVYLIFVAFAILSRFLTKKKDSEAPPGGPSGDFSDDRPKRPQRQVSFEELLREFTGEGSQQQKPAPVETSSRYDEYEEEPYKDQYARDEEAREVYQKSVKQAKDLKTIDELVDYNKVKTKLRDDFDAYHQEKEDTLADEIRRQLNDPSEVKKAVIYAEILQRKY